MVIFTNRETQVAGPRHPLLFVLETLLVVAAAAGVLLAALAFLVGTFWQ